MQNINRKMDVSCVGSGCRNLQEKPVVEGRVEYWMAGSAEGSMSVSRVRGC